MKYAIVAVVVILAYVAFSRRRVTVEIGETALTDPPPGTGGWLDNTELGW